MENSFEDLSKVTFYTKPETDLSYITMTPRKLVHHRKLVLSSFFVCRFFSIALFHQHTTYGCRGAVPRVMPAKIEPILDTSVF